jgi:Protein of unknown function (DUF3048) N-terminal domain/Protein of unknown function (DUF3048) C-terminal domain
MGGISIVIDLIKRLWVGHRAILIAVPAIVLIGVLAGGLLLVSAAGGIGRAAPTPSPTVSPTPTPFPTESPTPFITPSPSPTPKLGPSPIPAGWAYSDLDGVPVPAALAHREPIAVMIDDQVIARPQSGVSTASIVYQAPADGNQDRYMLVFQEGTANSVGPVRSVRTYYVVWAEEYKAVLGHFGGDSISLKKLIPAATQAKVLYNMDALRFHQDCPYHRIGTRPAPHNAYTATEYLYECAAFLKYPTTYQNLPTRLFRDDSPAPNRPTSQTISIAYRTGTIGYQFSPGTDSYLRIVSGKPELDPANNLNVYARSIVVMYQEKSISPNAEAGHPGRPDIANVGSGKCLIFQEGREVIGTWKKKSATALTRFYDRAGNEIPLVRGEIFIQSIPASYVVTVN